MHTVHKSNHRRKDKVLRDMQQRVIKRGSCGGQQLRLVNVSISLHCFSSNPALPLGIKPAYVSAHQKPPPRCFFLVDTGFWVSPTRWGTDNTRITQDDSLTLIPPISNWQQCFVSTFRKYLESVTSLHLHYHLLGPNDHHLHLQVLDTLLVVSSLAAPNPVGPAPRDKGNLGEFKS